MARFKITFLFTTVFVIARPAVAAVDSISEEATEISRQVEIPSVPDAIQAIAHSLDGRYEAVALSLQADEGQMIVMHDLAYEKNGHATTIRIPVRAAAITSMSFSPDAQAFACGTSDGTLILWRLNSGGSLELLAQNRAHRSAVNLVSFDRTGTLLYSRSDSKDQRLWDISSGRFKAKELSTVVRH